jgi:predicted metal-dependent hydrolase
MSKKSSPKQTENEWPIQVIRSHNRRKTVSAEVKQGVLIVRAPAVMSNDELDPIIAKLKTRLQKKASIKPHDNADLAKRAKALNREYFGGRLRWNSIRYVTNQNSAFGSCTPSRGTIRLSHRLATMPDWVRDYVIVHELAHLLEANHGPKFWELVNRYPLTERARGYLMAVGLEEERSD